MCIASSDCPVALISKCDSRTCYRRRALSWPCEVNRDAPGRVAVALVGAFSVRRTSKPKRQQGDENSEVGRQVTRKAPVLAGVTETAASNVEPPNFCRDSHEREGENQRR